MRTTPTAPRREPTRGELIFLQQWLREPTRIGAVAPSSPRLAAADVVVSSLPWASFGPVLQRRLTDAVTATLSPDSVFATFAYLHAQHLPQARRFRAPCWANGSRR